MSEHEQHDPDSRPSEWPTEGMTRHTLVLKGLAHDDEIPLALTFEYPQGKGMSAVRALRDYGRDLGMELMQHLFIDGDTSVHDTVEVTRRELAEQGIDIPHPDDLTDEDRP